jgi:spermidine/putrescine transport system permease protein
LYLIKASKKCCIKLWIALLTTSICLVIGYPLAYLISRIKGHLQVLLILLINAPMWINMLLRVRSIQQLLDIFSPTLYETDFALIFGMVYLFLPFMVLPIYTVLSKLDENYFEGAADLGANRFQTIQRVIIPLSLSGIISGVIMVFLPAATTLVVPQYLGKNVHFIGNVIEASITQQINGGYGYGAAISLVLSLIIVLMVFGMKKADKYQSGSNKDF